MAELPDASQHPQAPDRANALDRIVQAIPFGVAVIERERIVEVNRALCDLTGYESEELVGADPRALLYPPSEEDRVAAFMGAIGRLGRSETEISISRKEGSQFAAILSGRLAEHGATVLGICDVSHIRRREARLAEMASKDQLTGLLNKRSFLVNLAGEVARARRYGRTVALAILDLDGFKQVNDTVGHPAGDRVLAEAAGRLDALVRAGEHLARVGGDEFGWILPDADSEGATSAVARARAAIRGEPFRVAGELSLSAGICITDGTLDASEVYLRADRALYRAKAGDGNGIAISP